MYFYHYLNIILIGLSLFLFSFGCKNSPTFTADNELDPNSDLYTLEAPFNIQVEYGHDDYSNTEDVLIIRWDYPRSENYLNGFKVFRSDTDTSDFKEIGFVSKNSRRRLVNDQNYTYTYIDEGDYNGINVWYKIQAFYEQSDGILYAESEPFSYSASDFEINALIHPFNIDPVVSLEWDYSKISADVKIEFFSKTNPDADFVLEHTEDISLKTSEISLDVNQPVNTEYFYKLVLENIESDYKSLPSSIVQPSLDVLNSSIFSKNHAELHIGFKEVDKDSSSIPSNNYIVDEYQFKVLYATSDDTSQYNFLNEYQNTFSSPYSILNLNDLNTDNKYAFHIQGHRGNYKTHQTRKEFTYNYTVENTTSFNSNLPSLYFPDGDFNSGFSQLIFSAEHTNPVVLNIENKEIAHRFDFNLENFPSSSAVIKAKFGDYKSIMDAIITSNSKDRVKIWNPSSFGILYEIPNFRENIDGVANFFPVDFVVISEKELAIAYGDISQQEGTVHNYFITIWNHDTESHRIIYELYMAENMYSTHFKIALHSNTLSILYASGDQNTYLEVIDIHQKTGRDIPSFTNQMRNWSIFDLKYSNWGENLLIYSNRSIYQFETPSYSVSSEISDIGIDIYGIDTTEKNSITCYGGYKYPHPSIIECKTTISNQDGFYKEIFEGNLNLAGLFLSDNGAKLVAIFGDIVLINSFIIKWLLK